MSQHHDAPAPNPFQGLGNMFDSLESVNQAWRTMHLHSPFKPTLDIGELDKRIQELRTVEQWLSLNLTLLRNTIQAMEVQRGTLETLKRMSASFSSMAAQATGSRESEPSTDGRSPPPPAGLWPGLGAWPGIGSPEGAPQSPPADHAPTGPGGLPGMGGIPGLPGFGSFPGMPGTQAFGGMPWIPGIGEAPDISALFGGLRPTSADDTRAAAPDATTDDGKTSAQASSPSPAPLTGHAGAATPDPRHYTPPGWAAATGTDGWHAAMSAAPSPQPPSAEPESGPAATASSQLAQAWWQLMQQQLGQIAAQADRQAGQAPSDAHEAGTNGPAAADTQAAPDTRSAGEADTPAPPAPRRKESPPARG